MRAGRAGAAVACVERARRAVRTRARESAQADECIWRRGAAREVRGDLKEINGIVIVVM
jgi:hypothetical protein